MKKMFCINDERQPEGAELVLGEEYIIEREFINQLDQRVFIVAGINNQGTTRLGMRWYGYRADRFSEIDPGSLLDRAEEEKELELSLC